MLGLIAVSGTQVKLGDGSTYEIPEGTPGSYPWVRQASLIAKAYRDVGDYQNADKWQREYDKRRRIWDHAQAGADLQAIIAAAELDLLAPFQIVYDIASGIVTTVDRAADTVLDWGKALPWLVGGVVVVGAIAAFRGNLGYRGGRR